MIQVINGPRAGDQRFDFGALPLGAVYLLVRGHADVADGEKQGSFDHQISFALHDL